MRRSTLLLVLLLALLAILAGCGGSKKAATTAMTTAPAPAPAPSAAQEKAQIASVWTRFFAGQTPAAEKASLLVNGARYKAALEQAAKIPLASQAGAKVKSVTLTSPTTARVVYTITVSGKPVLQTEIGQAQKVGGQWKITPPSFCSLLGLESQAMGTKLPAFCKQTSGG